MNFLQQYKIPQFWQIYRNTNTVFLGGIIKGLGPLKSFNSLSKQFLRAIQSSWRPFKSFWRHFKVRELGVCSFEFFFCFFWYFFYRIPQFSGKYRYRNAASAQIAQNRNTEYCAWHFDCPIDKDSFSAGNYPGLGTFGIFCNNKTWFFFAFYQVNNLFLHHLKKSHSQSN